MCKPPTILVLAAALALAAPTALADTVILRDGRKLQGEVTWSDDKKKLEVKTRLGSIVVDAGDVVRVIIEETPEQELLRRRAALAPGDLAGRVALAEFCVDNRLERDAAALLLEVLAPGDDEDPEAPAPEAVAARRAAAGLLAARLDYHLVDGRWVPPEEYYPARGFVRHRGRWVRRELVELVQQLEAAEEGLKQRRVEVRRAERALEPARRALSEADAGVRKVERALANLGAEKVAAERDLSAREADVRAARDRVERARRNLLLFGGAGGGAGGDERAQQQLLLLQNEVIVREAELDRALRAADQARARADELARLEATGPQVRAEAQATRERAREALAAAEQALAAARAAVEDGAHEAESLKQRLEALKRE